MNLIVISNLTYNEGLYFRFLTMVAKTDLEYDILVESRKNTLDDDFKLLKAKGWYDFVDAMVTPEEREEGVRIDSSLDYPRTILTPSICCENMHGLLGQVKFLRDL